LRCCRSVGGTTLGAVHRDGLVMDFVQRNLVEQHRVLRLLLDGLGDLRELSDNAVLRPRGLCPRTHLLEDGAKPQSEAAVQDGRDQRCVHGHLQDAVAEQALAEPCRT
jgi:hypothetical protein